MPVPRPIETAPFDSTPEPGRKVWRLWGVEFDARVAQIVVVGTTILLIAFDNHFVQAEYDHFFLEFLIPLGIIVLAWREDPRCFGLRLGDWRLGLPIAIGGIAVMAVVIWYVSRLTDIHAYYAPVAGGRSTLRLAIDSGIDVFAWEFFFRGWTLTTLGRRYGADAIWLQAVPFALMHIGKPELEQLTTVLGGAFFGIVAWRTNSFLWGWLLHWFMVTWVVMVAAGYV
ncbi:MAG TPA: CPBP family intramembrane glutamic endopeptidase [Candidatus Limnocylindrales bacterium]